jgi:hypothetical protein
MTNRPDPDFDESGHTDLGDTWDPLDPAVDRRLRDLAGEVTPLHAPPHAFERVLVRGRRRRMRTAWTVATASTLACVLVVGGAVAIGLRTQSGPVQLAGGQSTGGAPTTQAPTGAPTSIRATVAQPTPQATSSQVVVAPSAASPGTVQAADVPRCHTANLNAGAAVVAGSLSGGHELMNLTLTNTSGHACTIYGYPGMKLEIQQTVGQATDVSRISATPQTLTVANGASASTTVEFMPDSPDSTEPQTGPCEPGSYYLEVTPPDETTQLITPISGGPVIACGQGALSVYPFVAGSTGPEQ